LSHRRNFRFTEVFVLESVMYMRMSLNMTWSGVLCGAILLGCHGLCSTVAASAPAALPDTPIAKQASVLPVADPTPAALAAEEGDEDNPFPYTDITARNPFRLNPAPPPPAPPQAPPPNLPGVKLSGTRTEAEKRYAMFAVTYKKDAKEPEKTTYMSLTEGEKEDPVELLEISPDGDEVTILNSGTKVVLNMKDNGFGSKGPGTASGPAPASLIRTPTPPGPAPQGPAATPAPVTTGINLGSSTGNTSSRRGNDMIVGGGTGTKTATASPQAMVASAGPSFVASTPASSSPSVIIGNSGPPVAANNTGLLTGGYVNPTPTPTPGPPIAIPINPGGGTVMPPNYTPPPSGNPSGVQLPPMPKR
jgi:hypothetical protein